MLKRFGKWFAKQPQANLEEIDQENIPVHVAIIMDGNGRWAKSRGLPRVAGHHTGMRNVKTIAIAADKIGVKILTLYAFSTENWKRPRDEVDFLMKLPQEFFPQVIDDLMDHNVQIRMMGWKEGLPKHTLEPIEEAIRKTADNDGLILNFALNYGSRYEMIQGFKTMLQDVQQGSLSMEQIDQETFAKYLLTAGMPDPDLMIRTSGELRISNFMLWQLAYSELWFTDCYWPEFTEARFYQAIKEYQRRARRYGGV
jgi:undecaprenyl diphosphate synthase